MADLRARRPIETVEMRHDLWSCLWQKAIEHCLAHEFVRRWCCVSVAAKATVTMVPDIDKIRTHCSCTTSSPSEAACIGV
jgi:hypothetical protein